MKWFVSHNTESSLSCGSINDIVLRRLGRIMSSSSSLSEESHDDDELAPSPRPNNRCRLLLWQPNSLRSWRFRFDASALSLSSLGRKSQLRLLSRKARRPGGSSTTLRTSRLLGTMRRRVWQQRNCSDVLNEQALISFIDVRAAVDDTIGYNTFFWRPWHFSAKKSIKPDIKINNHESSVWKATWGGLPRGFRLM